MFCKQLIIFSPKGFFVWLHVFDNKFLNYYQDSTAKHRVFKPVPIL